VRVGNVPDPTLRESTDAVVRVLRSCICDSDLWPSGSMPASRQVRRRRHAGELRVGEDAPLPPSLPARSDVLCTGHHGAVTAEVGPRPTTSTHSEQAEPNDVVLYHTVSGNRGITGERVAISRFRVTLWMECG
jgi:hypothetical protein